METDVLIPYEAIPERAWARLSLAANNPADMLRLMAVATVGPDGKPSNRTLVLRGADQASGLVWFHTDRRSPKMLHIQHRPFLSALGYDGGDQVQIRVDGEATLHQNDSLADCHWEQVSMAVRYAYGLPRGPGEPLPHPDPRSHAMHRHQKLGQPERGRDNFVVIQVRVEAIDWLQISSAGQSRAVLRADGGWKVQPLTP
jgi:hypothetical protein